MTSRETRLRWLPLACFVAHCALGCGGNGDVDRRLALARNTADNGEMDAASLQLTDLLQANPDNHDVRLMLARVVLATGNARLAERYLRDALRHGTPGADVYPELGRALLAQGQFEAALALGSGPPFQNGQSAQAWLLSATALLHMGRAPEAQNHYRQILALDPTHIVARVGLANALAADGDHKAAGRRLEALRLDAPQSVHTAQALGALRYTQDRFIEAEREFARGAAQPMTLDNAGTMLLTRVGLIESLWQVGKRSRAIKTLNSLDYQFPNHPLPNFLSALIAFDERDHDVVEERLRAVLRVIPGHLPSLQLLAANSFEQGRLGYAQMRLGESLEGDPDNEAVIQLLADIYLRMGNADQAVATLAPIMTGRHDAVSHDLFATAQLYAGNVDAAARSFRLAVDARPDDFVLQSRLASALIIAGKIQDADDLMRWWPTTQITQHSRTLLRMARFLGQGDSDRAANYAKRRRRDNPSDLHSLLALAEVAERSGDRGTSTQWLQEARRRNPDAAEPRIILAHIATAESDYELLQALAEEILLVQPYNAAALGWLGAAQLAGGQTSTALATFREAVRVAPDSLENLHNLARAQLARDDLAGALDTISTMPTSRRSTRGVISDLSGDTKHATPAALTGGR